MTDQEFIQSVRAWRSSLDVWAMTIAQVIGSKEVTHARLKTSNRGTPTGRRPPTKRTVRRKAGSTGGGRPVARQESVESVTLTGEATPTAPAGRSAVTLETLVPRAELVRVVDRLLARCLPADGGCLLHPAAGYPQIRARVSLKTYVTVSAMRAVWLVKTGEAAPANHDVMRTCEQLRCLAVEHLASRPTGDLFPAVRQRVIAASSEGSKKRRIYSDEQLADLRRRVDAGESLAHAADALQVGHKFAHLFIAGRARVPGGRYLKRGTIGNEQCSRCGEFGHRRNSPRCSGFRVGGGMPVSPSTPTPTGETKLPSHGPGRDEVIA